MDTQSKTYWVVPFLDDVAEFLSDHGMPESSSIVAEAAARVQRCSQREAGILSAANEMAGRSTSDRVVTLPFRARTGR